MTLGVKGFMPDLIVHFSQTLFEQTTYMPKTSPQTTPNQGQMNYKKRAEVNFKDWLSW